MGKPLENLKKDLHIEKEFQRRERIKRWKRAVKRVVKSSAGVNKEFQSHSRIKSE